jgi:transposase
MKKISIIGIDLAKNTFQLHGVDFEGRVILRRVFRRDQVVTFFANLPSCLVGMEACASSAYWARVIEECGHTVRRIHAKFIKPYR